METRIRKIFSHTLAKVCRKSKKITAFILTFFIGTGVARATGAYLERSDHLVTYGVSSTLENEVGYDDISVIYNNKVYSNDFVVLHISNKDFQDIYENRVIPKLRDNSIFDGMTKIIPKH